MNYTIPIVFIVTLEWISVLAVTAKGVVAKAVMSSSPTIQAVLVVEGEG